MTKKMAAKSSFFSKLLLIFPLFLLFVFQTPIMAQQDGTTQYVYDANGRLNAVIAPDGSAAIYQYDAAGNLVGISRSTTSLILNDFSPASGIGGTVVTIRGTGFNSNQAQNNVSFNGTAATVLSATPTELIVTVPAGGRSGLITVSNSNGTATSRNEFIITGDLRITSFTPNIGTQGATVTIEGGGFETELANNEVLFNNTTQTAGVTAASETQLTVQVPAPATSGKITVSNSRGSAISSQDFFIPPFGYDVQRVETTGALTVGEDYNLTLNAFPRIALLTFDGVAGKKASLSVLQNSGYGYYGIRIYRPDGGNPLLIAGSSEVSKNYDLPSPLPVSGRYLVVFETVNSTKNITLRVDQFEDISSSISPETSPVPVTIYYAGQNALLTFNGTAGQEISALMDNNTIATGVISILKPDGSQLTNAGFNTGQGFIDRITLPATGLYKIFLNPGGSATGSCQLSLYNVSDIVRNITFGQPGTNVSTTIPGQNIHLTLNGTQGQRLFLSFNNLMSTGIYSFAAAIKIYQPNGSLIVDSYLSSSGKGIDVLNLPATGAYAVDLDPSSSLIGSFTVSAGSTGIITMGPEVDAHFLIPGQTSSLNFNGTTQNVIRVFTDNPVNGTVNVYSPGGALIASSALGTVIRRLALPQNGIYRIEVTLDGNTTGIIRIVINDDTNGS